MGDILEAPTLPSQQPVPTVSQSLTPSVTTAESYVVGDLGPNYGYGARFNSATGQTDSPFNKGVGFLGDMAIKGADDEVGGMTELSRSAYLGGRELVDYPLIVPTLTESQVKWLVSEGWKGRQEIPEDIERAAADHARKRINAGKSPFASPHEANWNQFPNIARRPRPVAMPDTRTFTQTVPE